LASISWKKCVSENLLVTTETKNRSGKKKTFAIEVCFKYPTYLPKTVGQFVVVFIFIDMENDHG